MNQLYVGLKKEIEPLSRGFLLIDDEVRDIPYSVVFDPLKHSLNPLRDISHKEARAIADIVYTAYPQGESTLTVRNGKRALLVELLKPSKQPGRLDKIRGDDEVNKTIQDLLLSPVLRHVLCRRTNFQFKKGRKIQARLNRAELGDFDALVIGLFLMTHFKGQIIVPDGGFYLRDFHTNLIREGRLITGCNFLSELPPKIRANVLLFEEKIASRARLEDAKLLAEYEGLIEGTNNFNEFVQAAVS